MEAIHLLLLISVPLLLLLFKFKTAYEKRFSNERRKKLPPGPKKLPIIGNFHLLGPLPHVSLHKLSIQHGPLMFLQLGSIPTLVVSSAEAARDIIRSHDIAFSGRPSLLAGKKLTYNNLGTTFSPYGEHWRQARLISTVELLSSKRVQSFREVREEEMALLVSYIKACSSHSMVINLGETLRTLSNNITCRMALGKKYGGSGYAEGGNRFYRIIGDAESLLGGFCVADLFPSLWWIDAFISGYGARLERTFKELDAFYDEVIRDHLDKGLGHDNEDLVDVLLRLYKDPAHSATISSMDHIKGFLAEVFIAGTETTSSMLEWAMTELIRNPRVMTKLQQEIRSVARDEVKVEESDLSQLDYLKLVIKEVLRLHPPAPLLVPRETTEECRIKDYDIPIKTRVFINAKAIAMDPTIWENPEEFLPERFVGRSINFKGQDFETVPFGVGRRSCPGVNFAMVVIELAMANLLNCFDWELPIGMRPEDIDMEDVFGLTMHRKTPLCLVAK